MMSGTQVLINLVQVFSILYLDYLVFICEGKKRISNCEVYNLEHELMVWFIKGHSGTLIKVNELGKTVVGL